MCLCLLHYWHLLEMLLLNLQLCLRLNMDLLFVNFTWSEFRYWDEIVANWETWYLEISVKYTVCGSGRLLFSMIRTVKKGTTASLISKEDWCKIGRTQMQPASLCLNLIQQKKEIAKVEFVFNSLYETLGFKLLDRGRVV